MGLSVLIMTKNEEADLPGCIGAVNWSDDIVVVDSESTDRTRAIAEELGCRVVTRAFDDWSSHQNWILENVCFRNDWVFHIDADERPSNELVQEMAQKVRDAGEVAAYRMRRRDLFRGVWLKHATFYPTWLTRLYRPESVRFERLVNPIAVVQGPIHDLDGHIDHWPFSKGLAHWIARHNSYSDFEAEEYRRGGPIPWRNLLSSNPQLRRMCAKLIFSRLPMKPFIKFGYLAIVRRGFLDGRAGLDYCILQAVYEALIEIKVRHRKAGGDASCRPS